jgi:hypothetical protein
MLYTRAIPGEKLIERSLAEALASAPLQHSWFSSLEKEAVSVSAGMLSG